jgi:hypothetical protein
MLTLYSYPELFGVVDNNGYGLKVFAFLRLAGVPFRHEHIFDASPAPRGQLPYIVDASETMGDSDAIIAHVSAKHRLTIDAGLTGAQRDTDHLVTRMLDDLYWVMSYSRWKDERFWPLFRAALLREHPTLSEAGLRKAREFNFQRYHFQGIGRYAPTPPMRAGSRTCRCSPTSFRRAATSMATSRPASMPASMDSSPTSTSTRSRLRCVSSCCRTTISYGTVAPSMRR